MPSSDQETHKKYFADQFDDEEVLFIFRKHPVVMRKGLIFGLLGPLVGVLPSAIHPAYGMNAFFYGLGIGFILGIIIFLPSWIGWYFSIFIVTDQRFIQIKQKGLFTRGVTDISLRQVQSISYEIAGIQETLLGFGTIIMRTYVGELVIHDVHHPAKVQKKLASILREIGTDITSYTGPVPSLSQNEVNEEIE